MATAAATFLVISLWLAVLFGAQMRAWSWGPALVALVAALCCAAVAAFRGNRHSMIGPGTLVLGLATCGWFAWRAWTSPVPELAHADLLLLGAAAGCFLVARLTAHDARAEAVFLWGLAGVLLASIVMVLFQAGDTDFSHFRSRPATSSTGFFGHYNAGANFLIGLSFLLVGAAIFGRHPRGARLAWLLLAALGIGAIYFTRSRGAVLGVVVGGLALASLIVVIGSKRKAPWFGPAMIALPIVVIALGFLLFIGWGKTQELRSGGDSGVTRMMDNTSRLRNYSLAFETTMLHPLTGGGSRSYSWELMHVWDPSEHGLAGNLPQQTHNEILQAATDYGLIGAGTLLALLGWITLRGFWNGKFDEADAGGENPVSRDALRLGGFAALAGIFAQSNFSFVFHLLPGVMVLGLALGRLAAPSPQPHAIALTGRFTTAALAIAIAAALAWPGVTGTRVLATLAPVYFKLGDAPDDDARLDHFSRAIGIAPESEFHQARAMIHHRRALDAPDGIDATHLDAAIADYLAASRLHPKFPGHLVNAANLASLAGNDESAEALYEQAIRLQGNMEPAFLAHFHQAKHFHRKGLRHHQAGNVHASVRELEASRESFRQSEKKSAWITREIREVRNSIHLSLALAQEAAGDHEAALKTCGDALELRALEFRYHAGMIQYRRAMMVWHQRRPDEALPIFLNARNRLLGSRNQLPQGVSREAVQEHIDTIDETVKLLRGAGIRDE